MDSPMENYTGALAAADALKKRTKDFAIRIVKLSQALPRTDVGRTLGRQVLRSGTSVAANYRAVGRARSRAEFVSRIAVVVEEADETVFWLELLVEAGVVPIKRLDSLIKEANELLLLSAASLRTARQKLRQ